MLGLATLLLAVALPAAAPAHVSEGLVRSDPVAGATLGASPTAVLLSFSEPRAGFTRPPVPAG
jgi:methionine-rich copper-binding protein CopC